MMYGKDLRTNEDILKQITHLEKFINFGINFWLIFLTLSISLFIVFVKTYSTMSIVFSLVFFLISLTNLVGISIYCVDLRYFQNKNLLLELNNTTKSPK